MKKTFLKLSIGGMLFLTGCFSGYIFPHKTKVKIVKEGEAMPKNSFLIIPSDSVDNRATFSVIFPDNKALDYLYFEELQRGILTNNWSYDEDLVTDSIPLVSLRPLDQ